MFKSISFSFHWSVSWQYQTGINIFWAYLLWDPLLGLSLFLLFPVLLFCLLFIPGSSLYSYFLSTQFLWNYLQYWKLFVKTCFVQPNFCIDLYRIIWKMGGAWIVFDKNLLLLFFDNCLEKIPPDYFD